MTKLSPLRIAAAAVAGAGVVLGLAAAAGALPGQPARPQTTEAAASKTAAPRGADAARGPEERREAGARGAEESRDHEARERAGGERGRDDDD